MNELVSRRHRGTATATAVTFVGYAAGKGVHASQAKLGFPTGPLPSVAEHQAYARDVMDVAAAQWLAVASGLLAAVIVMATVTPWAHRLPGWLASAVLGVTVVAVTAGAVIVTADAFIGFGVGWSWYHGLVAVIMVGLTMATVRHYVRTRATSPLSDCGPSASSG